MPHARLYPWLVAATLVAMTGCPHSPEDGRPRGDGAGADGGNYRGKPIHVPSKIDGTKPIPRGGP